MTDERIGRVKAKHIQSLIRRRDFLIAEDSQGRANHWERAELAALTVAVAELRDVLNARVKEDAR